MEYKSSFDVYDLDKEESSKKDTLVDHIEEVYTKNVGFDQETVEFYADKICDYLVPDDVEPTLKLFARKGIEELVGSIFQAYLKK